MALVSVASRVSRAALVQLVLLDSLVVRDHRAVLVKTAHRANRANLALLERRAHEELLEQLEQRVFQEVWDLQVNLGRRVSQDSRVPLVQLDLRVSLDRSESQVARDLLEQLELMVL